MAASTNITKGQVCELNATHFLITSPVTQTAEVAHFVALANADNSAGAAGDISAPVAVVGHYVTVTADGAINPGRRVVISAATAGQVIEYAATSHAIDQVVGMYVGKEGGKIAKSGSTPFLESYTDNADFPPVAAADGDVVEILLQ